MSAITFSLAFNFVVCVYKSLFSSLYFGGVVGFVRSGADIIKNKGAMKRLSDL